MPCYALDPPARHARRRSPGRRQRRRRALLIRPAAPGDLQALTHFFGGLSPATLSARYLTPLPQLREDAARQEAARVLGIAPSGGVALLALAREEQAEYIVGVVELVRDASNAGRAEVAALVADGYQRRGIGAALCRQLLVAADQAGLTRLQAWSLANSSSVRRLMRRLGLTWSASLSSGTMQIVIDPPGDWLLHKRRRTQRRRHFLARKRPTVR